MEQQQNNLYQNGGGQPVDAASAEPLTSPSDRKDRVLTPIYGFRQRVRQHPPFDARLAQEPAIAGWTHNPWARHTPDAQATEIATRWLRRFNDSIVGYGLLPFTGVEINVPFIVTEGDSQLPTNMTNRIHHLYQIMQHHMNERYPNSARVRARLSMYDAILGRVYVDGSQLEYTTPAQSPMATVAQVNRAKRVMFEATHEFGRWFMEATGETNPDAELPTTTSAKLLNRGFKPFDIAYSTMDGPTSEHFSFSLIHASNPAPLTYADAKINTWQVAQNNLFLDASWKSLLQMVMEDYLPDDSMLAYGGKRSFNAFSGARTPGGEKHSFQQKGESTNCHENVKNGKESTRLEIRSFNNASSNIALTSLAVMAVVYATIKTMHDDPALAEKYLTNRQSISSEDRALILARMAERLAPNNHVPYDLEEAKARFDSSLVLRMMQEYIDDTVTEPKEKAVLGRDIVAFKQAVLARPEHITIERGVGR